MSSTDVVLTPEGCAADSESLKALCRDFRSGRMAHATLLTGEAGVGKKTLSHLLAKGLLCSGPEEKRPCGVCRECRRFESRTHPDALFPAPAPREKTIKIDALRGMIDTLSRHSLEGGRRVVVLDNAERMTPQAQNCLLKTLEEGAADTYFLLTADAETALLPTVRSRCRCVRFSPWPEERIEKELLRRGTDPARARDLSRYCEGSLGRALQMEQDESYWAARETVRRSFLSVFSPRDAASASALLKDQKDAGDKLLDILEQQIRDMLRFDRRQEGWENAPARSLRRILESILSARRQRYFNVSWAAVSDGILQIISEEANTWQA